jgi:hypothetical protein
MDLMQESCDDGRLMELAQDHSQRQALVLVVLNLQVLLPEYQFKQPYFTVTYFSEIGFHIFSVYKTDK